MDTTLALIHTAEVVSESLRSFRDLVEDRDTMLDLPPDVATDIEMASLGLIAASLGLSEHLRSHGA